METKYFKFLKLACETCFPPTKFFARYWKFQPVLDNKVQKQPTDLFGEKRVRFFQERVKYLRFTQFFRTDHFSRRLPTLPESPYFLSPNRSFFQEALNFDRKLLIFVPNTFSMQIIVLINAPNRSYSQKVVRFLEAIILPNTYFATLPNRLSKISSNRSVSQEVSKNNLCNQNYLSEQIDFTGWPTFESAWKRVPNRSFFQEKNRHRTRFSPNRSVGCFKVLSAIKPIVWKKCRLVQVLLQVDVQCIITVATRNIAFYKYLRKYLYVICYCKFCYV